MVLSKKEKILLIILGVLIVGYIYFNYFLSPVLQRISSSKSNIYSYETSLNSLNLTKLKNERNKKELEEIKNKAKLSEKALPKSERNPEIHYNLKVLGDKSNIIINSIDFGANTPYTSDKLEDDKKENNELNLADLNTVAVNINVTGDFKSIINFISDVEKDTRIAEVSSININNEDGAESGNLSANISINYYYIASKDDNNEEYDFNKGIYGKDDLFK